MVRDYDGDMGGSARWEWTRCVGSSRCWQALRGALDLLIVERSGYCRPLKVQSRSGLGAYDALPLARAAARHQRREDSRVKTVASHDVREGVADRPTGDGER